MSCPVCTHPARGMSKQRSPVDPPQFPRVETPGFAGLGAFAHGDPQYHFHKVEEKEGQVHKLEARRII